VLNSRVNHVGKVSKRRALALLIRKLVVHLRVRNVANALWPYHNFMDIHRTGGAECIRKHAPRGAPPPSKEVASLKTRGVGYGYPREHRVLPTPTLYDFEDCVVFIDREVTATDLIEKPRQLSRDQIESEVHTYTHIIHCFTCLLAYLPNSPCVLSLKGFKTIWARLLRGGNVRGLRCQQ